MGFLRFCLLPLAFISLAPVACSQPQGIEPLSAEPEAAQDNPIQIGQYPGSPFEDQKGNHWFSSVGVGVVRFDGEDYVTFTEKDGLGGNIIREIYEEKDGTLWFATSGGLTRFDGKSFEVITKYADPKLATAGPGFTGKGFHRELWDFHVDRKGAMWIATLDGVFRLEGDTFVRYPIPALDQSHPFEFTARMVYSIYEDTDGALWFATDGVGAVRDDGKEQVVYTEENGLSGNHVTTILRDRRGDLWFGTSGGGVSRLHDGVFTTHFRYQAFQDHGVGWGRFLSILEDQKGHVWFAVSGPGGGVHRFDGRDFRYFSIADGLGDGGAYSLKEDRAGILWLGSTSGVFRFDGTRFHNFHRSSSLPPR